MQSGAHERMLLLNGVSPGDRPIHHGVVVLLADDHRSLALPSYLILALGSDVYDTQHSTTQALLTQAF